MNTLIKKIIIGQIRELVTKKVYQNELIMYGSAGIDKLDAVLDDFWNEAEAFIKRGRENDNKYVPNFIEEPTQELTEIAFEELKNTFDLKKLIGDIVAEGKKETGKM